MAFRRKRIVTLFCGGSTIDPRDRRGESVRRAQDMEAWLAHMDELQIVADVDPVFVYGGEPAAIGPSEWTALAEAVADRYQRADGFLIIHDLETIATTANALAFMLQNLGLPVVLTGSPLRARRGGTSADARSAQIGVKANFVNALQVSTADVAEVCVVMGSLILRGSQVTRAGGDEPGHFRSADGSLLGKIDFGTRFFSTYRRRGRRAFRAYPKVEAAVVPYQLVPGMAQQSLTHLLGRHVCGVLVYGGGETILPKAVQNQLVAATRQGITVAQYVEKWDSRRRASPFLIVDQMAPTTALVKFMWARGQTDKPARLQKLLAEDIAGEHARARGGPRP